MDNRDEAADSSDIVAIHDRVAFHAYWMCVLGGSRTGMWLVL